jgi:phage tail sheath gpL-like
MADKKSTKSKKVNTTGVGGNSISIGGSVSGSNVVAGNNNRLTIKHGASADEIAKAFSTLFKAVEAKPEGPKKMMAQTAVQGLETESAKGEKAEEGKVQEWFEVLAGMAPDIWEVAVDTFTNPIKGLSTVFKKVAEKAKAVPQKS